MLDNPHLDDKISMTIDKRTKAVLQVLAAREQISLSDLTRFAIRHYVNAEYREQFDKIMKEMFDASTST